MRACVIVCLLVCVLCVCCAFPRRVGWITVVFTFPCSKQFISSHYDLSFAPFVSLFIPAACVYRVCCRLFCASHVLRSRFNGSVVRFVCAVDFKTRLSCPIVGLQCFARCLLCVAANIIMS